MSAVTNNFRYLHNSAEDLSSYANIYIKDTALKVVTARNKNIGNYKGISSHSQLHNPIEIIRVFV